MALLKFDSEHTRDHHEICDGILVTRQPGVTARERDITVKWAKRCIRAITKKGYELNVTPEEVRQGLTIKMKNTGWTCTGGRHKITMDVYVLRNRVRRFVEYAAIRDDQTIGAIEDADPEMIYAAIVAHEIAHHVQRRYGPRTRWLKNKHQKAHGKGWQSIYRILRREVINPHL